MNIEVVLTQDDPKLGRKGDLVKVSQGFANNFLFPHGKAVPATAANLKAAADRKAGQIRQDARRLEEARATAQRLAGEKLTIEVMAGEEDKLYGSVTSHDIHETLAARGFSLERKDIHLADPIRRLGSYEIDIRLHPQVSTKLKLWVVKKQ